MKFKKSAAPLILSFIAYSIVVNLFSSTKAVQAGNYGYINKIGKLVIKSQFSEVHSFSQGLAAVKIGNKWGYINKTGKLVIKPQFSETRSFLQGLAAVKIGNNWGYINGTGKVVVKAQFNETYSFSEGLAAVKVGDNWGYIDKTGAIVIKPQFIDAYSFSEGIAIVNRFDYIDKIGKQTIQIEVEDSPYSDGEIIDVKNFSQGLAAVQTGGGGTCGSVLCVYGYIDKTGKMIVEPEFFEAREFSQGLAAVSTNDSAGGVAVGEWGYINKRGQLVIKPIFSAANSFSEGLAAVEKGRKDAFYEESGETFRKVIPGKWGYIDSTGKQVISPKFDLANSFSEGLAAVKVKDKCGYINKLGKAVVKRRFSACADFSEGLAAVKTFAQ